MPSSWTQPFTAFLLLANLFSPSPSNYIPSPITHYSALLSISVKLTTRVADLRTSRGDLAGASRAHAIAQKMESLRELSLWKVALSLGLSHLRNNTRGRDSDVSELLNALGQDSDVSEWLNALRRDSDASELLNALRRDSDVSQLLNALRDLARLSSITERLGWIGRNYGRIAIHFTSLLEKLRKWGPLSEVVEIMQQEAREGKFMKDCLELLASDSRSFTQFLESFTLAYSATADSKMAKVQATTEEKQQNHEPTEQPMRIIVQATAEEKPQNHEPTKQSMWWITTTEEKLQNHEPAGTLPTKQPMWFISNYMKAYALLAVLMIIIFAFQLISTVFGEKTKNPTRHARRKAKRVNAGYWC